MHAGWTEECSMVSTHARFVVEEGASEDVDFFFCSAFFTTLKGNREEYDDNADAAFRDSGRR